MKTFLIGLAVVLGLSWAGVVEARVESCSGYRANGDLAGSAGIVAVADSANQLDVGRRLHSAVFCLILSAGTGTAEVQNSIDGGTIWDTVNGTSTTATECFAVDNPVGLFKARATACTGCNWKAQYMCGAGVGGRP